MIGICELPVVVCRLKAIAVESAKLASRNEQTVILLILMVSSIKVGIGDPSAGNGSPLRG
jgi:hypothetical protein